MGRDKVFLGFLGVPHLDSCRNLLEPWTIRTIYSQTYSLNNTSVLIIPRNQPPPPSLSILSHCVAFGDNTRHYDPLWAWQEINIATQTPWPEMDKSERSSDQPWACFGFLSRRFGFRRSLRFRRNVSCFPKNPWFLRIVDRFRNKKHYIKGKTIQKPTKTRDSEKMGLWTASTNSIFTVIYIYLLTLFTVYMCVCVWIITPRYHTVSCTSVNHSDEYVSCALPQKTIHYAILPY